MSKNENVGMFCGMLVAVLIALFVLPPGAFGAGVVLGLLCTTAGGFIGGLFE